MDEQDQHQEQSNADSGVARRPIDGLSPLLKLVVAIAAVIGAVAAVIPLLPSPTLLKGELE